MNDQHYEEYQNVKIGNEGERYKLTFEKYSLISKCSYAKKSDLINNMDHMRISSNDSSSTISRCLADSSIWG